LQRTILQKNISINFYGKLSTVAQCTTAAEKTGRVFFISSFLQQEIVKNISEPQIEKYS
jgi:hypothetical protein